MAFYCKKYAYTGDRRCREQCEACKREGACKAAFTKRGPKHDYTGSHVTLVHDGRTLLGTIVYICPDEYLCQVRHFNGEMWPINPSLARLEILGRTYD